MRIHITCNYYINAGPKGFILKEEYKGRTKAGEPRKGERFIGSYNNISAAVHRCLQLNVLNGAQAVELWEYAKMVEESNKVAVNSIKKEIEACGLIE
jgi:hypothetical protein